MQTKIGTGSALEPRAQSTRAGHTLAQGYTPPRTTGLMALAFRLRNALRARLRGPTATHYGEGELYLAFVGGLLLATCVFVPFLPRLAY